MLETGWRARLKWYSFLGNRQQTHTHLHVQSITHSDQDCDQKTLGHQTRNLTWSKRGRFEEVTFKQRHKSQIKARQKQRAGVEESFLEKEQRVRA